MAKVSLNINGRKYVLGCDDGEEDRLLRLGEKLDSRISDLSKQFGQIGDLRLLVMAGITLTDENDELKSSSETQSHALTEDLRKKAEATQIEATQDKVEAADSLLDAAKRIERLAERLSERRTP